MLSAILGRSGSDKASGHSYAQLYDELLTPFEHSARAVLEVGVYAGSSILAWHEFFKNALIVGVDWLLCSDCKQPPDRYVYIEANCKKPETLQPALAHGPFDVVIDDGSHEPFVQVATFASIWPHVRASGIYIIEDVQRIEDGRAIAATFGGELLDRRSLQGRPDDILVLFRKSA